MKHTRFIKNAAILTVTSLVLRTVGIFFRIWMSNTLGAAGMGLYQLVFSVYVLVTTFATCGICTAVTRMVSELRQKGAAVKKIMRRAVELSLIIALLSAFLLYISADLICTKVICDTRATASVKLLCLGLPGMGIASCIRGYFIAVRKTSFPSIAQLGEQLFRIAVIVILVGKFAKYGLTYTCAAVIIGDVAAETFDCLILWIFYKAERRNYDTSGKQNIPVTRWMLHIAVPITAGRYIHTFLRTVENMLVPSSIAKFTGDREKSLAQFGMLKGMALPLLFFPASFLMALSTLMIPEISEALSLGKMGKVRTVTEKSVGITVIVSVLIGGVFFMCGRDISTLLYSSEETGILITALAPLVPLMYLESVCDGILKGLDQQTHSFLYGVIDSGTRILLIILILPSFGMRGFLVIMIYSNLLTSLLNLRRLLKVTDTKVNLVGWIFKPLICIAIACAAGFFASQGITGLIPRLAVSGGIICGIYLLLMFFSGGLKSVENII